MNLILKHGPEMSAGAYTKVLVIMAGVTCKSHTLLSAAIINAH